MRLAFSKEKKDLGLEDPSSLSSKTLRINMNIQCLPFAMGQRGGKRAKALWTKYV
jgi:hypothetical protein